MKTLLVMVALATALFSQEGGKPQHAKLVRLQNVKPHVVYKVVSAMVPKGSTMTFSDDLATIMISGPPEVVAMIEDNIRRLDVAPPLARNIEITAFMILGTPDTAAKTPDDLAGVVKQLRAVFPHQGYRLVETMLLRSREGLGGEASGMMPAKDASATELRLYQFRFGAGTVEKDEKGNRIKLNAVRFGARLPYDAGKGSVQYADVGANTDVDIREGQKVVIGKASLGPGQESLFLVLSAKVVD